MSVSCLDIYLHVPTTGQGVEHWARTADILGSNPGSSRFSVGASDIIVDFNVMVFNLHAHWRLSTVLNTECFNRKSRLNKKLLFRSREPSASDFQCGGHAACGASTSSRQIIQLHCSERVLEPYRHEQGSHPWKAYWTQGEESLRLKKKKTKKKIMR